MSQLGDLVIRPIGSVATRATEKVDESWGAVESTIVLAPSSCPACAASTASRTRSW